MSLEVCVKFMHVDWYKDNKNRIKYKIKKLPVFLREVNEVLYLRNGAERGIGFFSYDTRFFFEEDHIFIDIFSNEIPIVVGLRNIFLFLEKETLVVIEDEDGNNIDWYFE